MVWRAISNDETMDMISVEGSLNAQRYLQLIQNQKEVKRNKLGTAQGNPPVHVVEVTLPTLCGVGCPEEYVAI